MDLDVSFFEAISGKKNVKELRIGAYSSITNSALIPLLAKLKEEVVLNVTTKELYELESVLISGEVDFILTTKPISRQNVICDAVAQERQVHVIPSRSDGKLPFLDHDEEDQTTFKFLKSRKIEMEVTRSFFDEVNGIIKAVECGLGQAIVSEHLVLKNKKLKIKKKSGSTKETVYLCYYEKAYYPEVQKQFIESVKNDLLKYS
jgi:DNA-binding transcriptional LysR family regulator